MTKFLTVLATGTALAAATIVAPTSADARCRGCGVAAGVIGGIAAGAAIAGAASGPYYYGPGYAYDSAYDYGPGYAYGGPYYGRYYGWPGATSDFYHSDRDLVGTR